ncbi:hypothetical protein Tco_1017097 [Tanacetum coccineum]|uniref:Uncharacterized protein n=1 Tax=Tanacetum coccineum TaxID=301880 RepID=A0ABQ5FT40_9ASTR
MRVACHEEMKDGEERLRIRCELEERGWREMIEDDGAVRGMRGDEERCSLTESREGEDEIREIESERSERRRRWKGERERSREGFRMKGEEEDLRERTRRERGEEGEEVLGESEGLREDDEREDERESRREEMDRCGLRREEDEVSTVTLSERGRAGAEKLSRNKKIWKEVLGDGDLKEKRIWRGGR